MTIVRCWTGHEAKLLREALRLSVRDFAAHLGVGVRTVNKWEARLTGIKLRPHMQEVMDTALARASADAQARFTAVVQAGAPAPPRDPPQTTTAPTPSGMLPVVVDGGLVFVPLDLNTLATGDPGAIIDKLRSLAPSLTDARHSPNCLVIGDEFAGCALPDDSDPAIFHGETQEFLGKNDSLICREVLNLISAAGALLVIQRSEPPVDWERLEHFSNQRGRSIDSATTDDLGRLNNQLWRIFTEAKRKRAILPFVRKQLDLLTDALRRSLGDGTRQHLCALAGDLFQLAGEIFFDNNQYTCAAHCYTLAITASKEANEFDLWACAMARYAFIGIYKRKFDKSSHMLEAAATLASRGDSTLSTRQWVHAVQAQSLAGLGELDECRRALDKAAQVEQLTGRINTGGWLRFDGSRLAEERGACYVELKRPDLADTVLTQALNQDLSPRRRGSVLIDLAMIGAQRRDTECLVMYAGAALDTARQTGSGVIRQKLRSLQTHLSPFLGDRHIRHLNAQITALTRASTGRQ